MNKKLFLIIIAIFLPIALAVMFLIPFEPRESAADLEIDYAFEITNFLVNVDAKADRHVYMEETIEVNFIEPRAAIIRAIPVNAGLQIRDINVRDRAFSVRRDGNFLLVDLDAANEIRRRGEETYTLTYTMITPEINDNADSIALNVIGQGWPVKILNAEINIILPAEPVNSEYYVGHRGVTGGKDRLKITETNNEVKITIDETLYQFEGVTVGYDMPEGTMYTKYDNSFMYLLIIGLIIVALSYYLYLKFGKDDSIIPIVNFTPPEGIDPAAVGLLIDGMSRPSELTSLIFYWASKGYLEIEESSGNDVILRKQNDLKDDHKSYEKTIFDGLFKDKNEVRVKSLKDNFYPYITTATSQIKTEYPQSTLYKTNSSMVAIGVCLLLALFIGISVFVISFRVSSVYFAFGGFFSLIPAVVVFVIGTLVLMLEPKIMDKKTLYYVLYALGVLTATIIIAFILRGMMLDRYEMIVLSLTFGLVMCFAPFINSRTDEYNKKLNDLVGFKNFIAHAEKDRIELLLKDNPQYYYDILPYANVMGVSKEWSNKFKDLTVEPPTYYRGYSSFNFVLFCSTFNRTMSTITTNAISKPSNKGVSGGGFGGGGGGFSGGGFGGGGGFSR